MSIYFTFTQRMNLSLALLTRLETLETRIENRNGYMSHSVQGEAVNEYYGQVQLGILLDPEFPARTIKFIEPRVWSL